MPYQVFIEKRVLKFIEHLNEPYYSKLKNGILSLTKNPRPPGTKKLKGRNAYRLRFGNYRVIYEISDKKLIVSVIHIGHRKEVYD